MRGFVRSVRGRVASFARLPVDALRSVAARTAAVDRLPTSVRAVLAHFANGGRLDIAALRLQPRVEDAMDRMVEAAFDPVEAAVAEEYGVEPGDVDFDYETKLLMPAELTLARLYRSVLRRASDGFDPIERRVDPGLLGRVPGVGDHADGTVAPEFSHLVREADRIDRATELVVVALLDGDMRDAINDDEYADFEVSVAGADHDRRTVAGIAQRTLQEDVQRRLDRFPESLRGVYDRAVDASEAHQDDDDRFRRLLEAARDGEPDATERIRDQYRDADFEDPPDGYDPGDLDLPYFRTQYDRVGVIYDGMIEMYGEVGLQVDDAFRRAIVLAIIGAQVWLDDVDDFEADMREGQLTPVTAEYLLADSEDDAYRRVVDLTERYMDRAREYAAASESTLVGIAVEYILLSGDPGALPGAPDDGDSPGVPDPWPRGLPWERR